MAAHVETSNFSSGYAWAKCSDCGWRGTKHIGAGKLSNDQARKEAAAHDAEAHDEPTADELHDEIVTILEAKGAVRFCPARYALSSCYHAANHKGAHHTIGLDGAVKAF